MQAPPRLPLPLLPPTEHCVVAYCQGHTAWLSGLAFDPWCVYKPAVHIC